jgi:hypothetical protein
LVGVAKLYDHDMLDDMRNVLLSRQSLYMPNADDEPEFDFVSRLPAFLDKISQTVCQCSRTHHRRSLERPARATFGGERLPGERAEEDCHGGMNKLHARTSRSARRAEKRTEHFRQTDERHQNVADSPSENVRPPR